ncbi:MAG: tetratricopeptide repeat protein [Alphaproteobacteria bacterium]|nr:tetratricopeptide repeat protein [Alphaproteobacteria bacterium]
MSFPSKLHEAVDAHIKGRLDDAERLYREFLTIKPDHELALHHLGLICYEKKDFPEAERLIRKAVDIQPSSEAMSNLGLVLAAMGHISEAIMAQRESVALKPDNSETLNNLGSLLMSQGQLNEARECFLNALKIKPDFLYAQFNLGYCFQKKNEMDKAIEIYQKLLAAQPNFPEAYCNLGLIYAGQGKREEAIEAYKKAIEYRPNFLEALNNLGQVLGEANRLEEATEVYSRAFALRPDFPVAVSNLSVVLRRRGMLEEALKVSEKSFSYNPSDMKLESEIITLRRYACAWKTYEADRRRLLEIARTTAIVEPFALLNASSSPAEQLACAQNWSSRIPQDKMFNHSRERQPGRIRIGYLSSDFYRHATAYLIADLLERHDRIQFEVFTYSYGFDDGSEMRQRLIKASDHFVDMFSSDRSKDARRIFDDKIDILVDLKGYTANARPEILAMRPAPVQVNYVGYPGTMGSAFMDYIIADAFVIPAGNQAFFDERLVHIPHCYQPSDSKRQIDPKVFTRSELGLPEWGFVFCCFNNVYKITPEIFNVWMRLLNKVPGSVLWLLTKDAGVKDTLRREAVERGVAAERLVFAEGLDLPLHLARQRTADLFLDTLPVCAHTTANDALWAGLPLLTCVGESFVGRVAGSLLNALGVPELITTSLEEYEARALELAQNPHKLAEIKNKVANRKKTSALFNMDIYTRCIEKAYAHMFDMNQAGKQPEAFQVFS